MSLAKLSDVWTMLKVCAPGYTKETRGRNYCVRYKDREYPQIPLGAPGEKRPQIKLGQIRQMARQLGLDEDCVNRHFQNLM
jgi:hypothetical protein